MENEHPTQPNNNRYGASPEPKPSSPSLRRSQVLARMQSRQKEKEHRAALNQAASLRSSQRLAAAAAIQQAKQQRENRRAAKKRRLQQQLQDELGQKIQTVLHSTSKWAEKSNSIRVLKGTAHPIWKEAVQRRQALGKQAHQSFSRQTDQLKQQHVLAQRISQTKEQQEQVEKKKRGQEAHRSYVKAHNVLSPALAALHELHEAMYSPKEGMVTLDLELQQDPHRRRMLRHLRYESRAANHNKWWGVALALADASLVAKDHKKMERAFVNWTKCAGHIFETVPVSRALAQRLNLYPGSSEDEDDEEATRGGATVDQLRYEFSRTGEDAAAPATSAASASNQLYIKLCRKAFANALKGTNIPHGVERIPKGRGLHYLQRWATEEKDIKSKAFQDTLKNMKQESIDMWDQWASLKDKLMFSIPSSLGHSMTGPIPFRYMGNGTRPPRTSNGSEAPNQYHMAGERSSQPKFNSALLALATGRVAANDTNTTTTTGTTNGTTTGTHLKVWGIRSNDPSKPYKDVEDSKRLVQRLQEQQQRAQEENKERASLAQEHFTMFQRHTRNLDRARALVQQGGLSKERARDDDAWLAIGRILYAMGPQLEDTFVDWSLLHRTNMDLPGTLSIGKGQKTGTTTAFLIDHLLPGDCVVVGGGRQVLTVSSTVPIERTTVTFEEPSLRTVRDGTIQRNAACSRDECRRRWSEMCHPYVVPSLSRDHWVRIRRARRFIQGERKRANEMRTRGQQELVDEAEHNANMLLRELKKTVMVEEVAFVSFGAPTLVPLLDPTTAEPLHLIGHGHQDEDEGGGDGASIHATLCVADVINIDDTKEWWDVLQINAEQATVQIRVSPLVEGLGDGPLRFRTVPRKVEANGEEEEDIALTPEERLEDIETLKELVMGSTRWITIQEAQCASGCFVKRSTAANSNEDDDEGNDEEDNEDGKGMENEVYNEGTGTHVTKKTNTVVLFHLPFLTSSSALRQLEAWSKEDTHDQQREAKNQRWQEWNTARAWLRHESKSKHSACLDLVRRLNPTRANVAAKWTKVGQELHALSFAKETFLAGTQSVVPVVLELHHQQEQQEDHQNMDRDDETKEEQETAASNDPYGLFIAWTAMSEKWQRLVALGFDTKELDALCSDQWQLFEAAVAPPKATTRAKTAAEGILELPQTNPATTTTAKPTCFQLESLKDALSSVRSVQYVPFPKQHPMLIWLHYANEYMASLLRIENTLRHMLGIDVALYRKKEERRRVPTISIVHHDDTTARLSWWWSKSEPWSPVEGTVYQVHLYEVVHEEDDIEDVKKYMQVYSGQGSECTLKRLKTNTVYSVRMKSIFTPTGTTDRTDRTDKTTTKASSKWGTTTRFNTLSSPPVRMRVTKQIAAGRRFRAVEIEWRSPANDAATGEQRRPPRYEVEMKKMSKTRQRKTLEKAEDKWVLAWRGTKRCCEIGDLKRGTTVLFRVCQMNYEGLRSQWSETLKVRVQSTFRSVHRRRKSREEKEEEDREKEKENTKNAIIVVVEGEGGEGEGKEEENKEEGGKEGSNEVWHERYDQRTGGFYFISSWSGERVRELPPGFEYC